MNVSVVLVHGIRTSATMWRSQVAHLRERGIAVTAVDLPGHGTRLGEPYALDEAFATIDAAVRAATPPVLLVGHSMGGLLSTAYLGRQPAPPVAGYIGASCTAIPRGPALLAYRTAAGIFNHLPRNGQWFTDRVLDATLPTETRPDFGAGGYAFAAQDAALASMAALDLRAALKHIHIPVWWMNGQYDQLRTHESLFRRLTPQSEFYVVPRTSHLVTAMRPQVFNALLDLAIATVAADSAAGPHSAANLVK